MSELIDAEASGNGKMVISEEMIPFGAYQAIYHKLTNKVETISRDFNEPRFIKFDDIKHLHLRIIQLLEQYHIKGMSVQITHSLKDSYSQTYSSFEKFSISNMSSPECTSSINYEVDFLIVLPSKIEMAKEVAQRYKLSVTASQAYIDDDLRLPSFIRELGHVGGVQLHLEYSDYAVAQTIDAAVLNWFKCLGKREASPVMKLIMGLEVPISQFADAAVRSAAFVAGAVYLAVNQTSAPRAVSIALFCLAIGFFSYSLVLVVVRRFYKSVRMFAPSSTILLTEGDAARHSALEKVKATTKGFMALLFSSVVIAFAVNILAAVIYARIFPQ